MRKVRKIREDRIAIQLTRANANRLAKALDNHHIQFIEDYYDDRTGIWDLIIKHTYLENGERVDEFRQVLARDWVVIYKNGDIDVYDSYWMSNGHSYSQDDIEYLHEVFDPKE